VPVVVSVLPEDEPIEELLPDVLGLEDDELVSLLLEGVLVLEEPVPEAPIDELLLGVLALEPLDEPVPDAPIELDDEGDVLEELDDGIVEELDEGEVVDEPVELEAPGAPMLLVPEPDVSPPVFGAVDVLLLLPPVLPALDAPVPVPEPEVPPVPAAPPAWARAYPLKARAAAAARVVMVDLVALMLNSLD